MKRFNHTSWVAVVVTPIARDKLVCNRSVIEVFGGVFVLSLSFLGPSVGVRTFVIGLSHISFFSLSYFFVVFIFLLKKTDTSRKTTSLSDRLDIRKRCDFAPPPPHQSA